MIEDPVHPVPDLLGERATALSIIESWESKIRILFQDYADATEGSLQGEEQEDTQAVTELVEETLQERLEEHRVELFERLKTHFSKVERDAPSKLYEAVVHSLVSDRMRRYYGYYEAIQRLSAEAAQLNNNVGEQVFKVDVPQIQKLLQSIDEIYFVKYLCTGLGLDPEITDRIVNYQVDREFKPKSK